MCRSSQSFWKVTLLSGQSSVPASLHCMCPLHVPTVCIIRASSANKLPPYSSWQYFNKEAEATCFKCFSNSGKHHILRCKLADSYISVCSCFDEIRFDVLTSGHFVSRAIHDVKATDMGLSKVRFKAEVDFDGRVVTRSYLEKQDIEQILNVRAKRQGFCCDVDHLTWL